MVNKPRLYCRTCNKEFDHLDPVWRCSCGGLLDLDFQVEFPLTAIRERPASLWRYREAIPVLNDKCIVTYDEGFTPLLPLTLYRKKVLVKQDHLFPTGSYKDRGASILISKLKEIGVREIVEDSSGNAGASIAAYAARGGIKCTIFVPKGTARSKKEQVKLYGASIDDSSPDRVVAAKRALEKARQTYYASHCWNPYFFQGTKTFIFEIWEQMGYRLPDTLLLPVGNGSLLIGVYIGCQDLLKAGLID
ncbi:MAG: pyridoxal-phosphate dependent enzyme, partial [Candidatus Cloacimonetes bacterium]|nr:pyridoxal-phosphate dependent enzyme [Candidatus Cloacimonadota bacterium]